MGLFQLLREPQISSRGRGLHKPKVEPPQKHLTSGHMTQAQTRREAHQRQAHRQGIAFWHTGYFPPEDTHTHTHTTTDRERGRKSQRVKDRERRENGRHTNTYTQRQSYSRGITGARLLGRLTRTASRRA
uniref:Uncharacterized protein n=1 Tax=Piliocolobus tephrosceles TaxID=591936 RepID=A0A8C9GUS1_9PRIM